MNILLSGSNGFIGTALAKRLAHEGHRVIPLVRSDGAEARWDPTAGTLSLPQDLQLDAVIHLAGENVASGIWTRAKMERIRSSRTLGTTLLAKAIAQRSPRPKVFISASAIGFYGDRGDEVVDELSSCGEGFLAKVCAAWEESTGAAADAGVRVVNPRFGLVLDRSGGMLARIIPPFRLALGGRLGNGRQYMSWITLRDAVDALMLCLTERSLSGPINFVTPNPVTNREFTASLARALHRPAIFPVPRRVLGFIFGKMADEALLASTRVKPLRLEQHNFTYRDPELNAALATILADKG